MVVLPGRSSCLPCCPFDPSPSSSAARPDVLSPHTVFRFGVLPGVPRLETPSRSAIRMGGAVLSHHVERGARNQVGTGREGRSAACTALYWIEPGTYCKSLQFHAHRRKS